MATLLDATLLGHAGSFFVFLLIFVVTYGILSSIKLFGELMWINTVVAIVMASVFAGSTLLTRTVELSIPWLTFLFMIVIFISIMTKFMDVDKSIFSFKNNTPVISVVLILMLVIFFVALGQANQEKNEKLVKDGVIEEGSNPVLTFPQKLGETVRNPAVLGLILVFLTATFAVALLGHAPTK